MLPMKLKRGEVATSVKRSWQFYKYKKNIRYRLYVREKVVGWVAVYFYFRMVGRNSKAHQSEGHGQTLVHVYNGVGDFRHYFVGSVEARWAGANDCHAEGAVILGGGFGGVGSVVEWEDGLGDAEVCWEGITGV